MRGGRQNGGRRPPSGNRNFESNGPDVKIRGTAMQCYEKYSNLARDANGGGDRVAAEGYQQHAEHYYRIMTAQNQNVQAGRQNNAQQAPAEAVPEP